MSVVTGVMLVTSLNDPDAIVEVQGWLAEKLNGQQLIDLSDHGGGGKHPQFAAWTAGINYFLDADAFAAFVLSRDWWNPENVVLILQPEDGPTRVFKPTGPGPDQPHFIVGDVVTRDGSDRQVVLEVGGYGDITVECIVAPHTGWCEVGDKELNLAGRYTLVTRPRKAKTG